MHFYTNEVSFRVSASETDQVLAVTEPNFQATLGNTAENSVEIKYLAVLRDIKAEPWPQLGQRPLLGGRDSTRTQNEAADLSGYRIRRFKLFKHRPHYGIRELSGLRIGYGY
jgi:hypothetical protein